MVEDGVVEIGAEPGIVTVGLEHEEAGEAAEPVDVGEAGGGSWRHGGCGRIVADFGFWEEKAGEEAREDNAEAQSSQRSAEKRNPRAQPLRIRSGRAGMAVPQGGGHEVGATVFGGGIVSYGGRAIRIGVALGNKKQDCWLTSEERTAE